MKALVWLRKPQSSADFKQVHWFMSQLLILNCRIEVYRIKVNSVKFIGKKKKKAYDMTVQIN